MSMLSKAVPSDTEFQKNG